MTASIAQSVEHSFIQLEIKRSQVRFLTSPTQRMSSMVSAKAELCGKPHWELTGGVVLRISKTSPWSSLSEKKIAESRIARLILRKKNSELIELSSINLVWFRFPHVVTLDQSGMPLTGTEGRELVELSSINPFTVGNIWF